SFTGNLDANAQTPTTNLLISEIMYTTSGGTTATGTTKLAALDQISGGSLAVGDIITITGTTKTGGPVSTSFTVADLVNDDIQDVLDVINGVFTGSTAKIIGGKIQLLDAAAGYSQTNLNLGFTDLSGGGVDLELPPYFLLESVGSEGMYNTSVEVFDTQGITHMMSVSFVRSTDPNIWDMVVTSVTGGVDSLVDRRIKGIEFLTDTSFGGMSGGTPDTQTIELVYSNNPGATHTITFGLGTIGENDGLSLSGIASSVTVSERDGYESGQLVALEVSVEGILSGLFTNSIRKDIAAIKLATFQNPSGLASVGNNYYTTTGNSGDPVPTQGLSSGAGAVRGGTLEGSNVEIAAEFVNLIQAQNGFQANARTIRVANEILRELASIIR
ncbi:MAG TPA: flagellar hook-basal body complex protein, partial [Phycisphaerae bacterium]|nr:flagellar hook-basal body complex protein [Phycisphaerae bacterium]